MFRIFAVALGALVTLAYPGLAFITVPLAIIWADHLRQRVANLREARQAYLDHEAERRRHKMLRSL